MGTLFSTSNDNSELEYQKSIQELKEEQQQLEAAALNAERVRDETLKRQYERQKEIASERVSEIKETIRRATELKDARKALNIQAGVLLCALYYNYPFGTLEGSALDSGKSIENDNSWQNNATDICNVTVNVNVFWLLCKIPQLLPLLWPTGRTEDAFHKYASRDSTGNPVPNDYNVEVNGMIESYVDGPLKQYVSNVFQANCSRDLTIDTDGQTKLYEKCGKLIEQLQDVTSDAEWVTLVYQFIKDDDKMRWKGFVAKSGKGICKSTVELLPATYPKLCPKYELYEALLMLSNTVINTYGQCKTSTGSDVKAVRTVTGTRKVKKFFYELNVEEKEGMDPHSDDDIIEVDEPIVEVTTQKPDTSGGECFALKDSFVNKAYDAAIDNTTIWDGQTFVPTTTVPEEKITSSSDTKSWMESTDLFNELEIYYLNNTDRVAEANGLVRYKNPTKKYTCQFLNDVDGIIIPFQIPRLSANINAQFRKSFLYNAFMALTTVPENEQYDLYRTNNKALFTSIDYMTMRPPALDDWAVEDDVMPLPRFIYSCLIEYSCKWNLTVPVNNTVSMSMINGKILSEFNDKSLLPQYLWTPSPNITYKSQDPNVTLSSLTAPAQMKSSDVFIKNNVITIPT